MAILLLTDGLESAHTTLYGTFFLCACLVAFLCIARMCRLMGRFINKYSIQLSDFYFIYLMPPM